MKEYIFTCLALHCRIAEMYVPIDSWVNFFFNIYWIYPLFFLLLHISLSLSLPIPHFSFLVLFYSVTIAMRITCSCNKLISIYHFIIYKNIYPCIQYQFSEKGFLIKKLVYSLFDLYLACQQGLYIYA